MRLPVRLNPHRARTLPAVSFFEGFQYAGRAVQDPRASIRPPSETHYESGRSFNRQFLAELKNRCDFASNECRLSLRDLFGGAENIYFVDKMGAAFDKCTIFHASDDLKRLYTPLCQYVLFEKHGEIAAYLRGFCMSDIREEGDKVGFSPAPSKFFGNFFVTKMNANEQIVVSGMMIQTGKDFIYIAIRSNPLSTPCKSLSKISASVQVTFEVHCVF